MALPQQCIGSVALSCLANLLKVPTKHQLESECLAFVLVLLTQKVILSMIANKKSSNLVDASSNEMTYLTQLRPACCHSQMTVPPNKQREGSLMRACGG